MISNPNLEKAKALIEMRYGNQYKSLIYQPKLARIIIIFENGVQIYIRYNLHEEYSYSVIFSDLVLDRVRFDNHDDRWNVPSRPHHFHPRNDKVGYNSLMVGLPSEDVPLLFEFYMNGLLFQPITRF